MRFVVLQILSFTFIFLLLFSFARVVMGLEFLGLELSLKNPKDTLLLFCLGIVRDLRLISAAFLPLLAVMILTLFQSCPFISVRGGGAFKENL